MLETLALSWRVTLRHWDVYRQNFLANISPTISDPIFFILALGVGLGGYLHEMRGMSYLVYLAPGLAVGTALFTSFFETSYGFFIRHTYEGVYRAILTTPVGPREIIFGEFIWVALKSAAMATGVTLVLLLFQVVEPHWAWTIPPIGILIGLSCGAIGFIATSMVRNINQFQTVYAFLINPLFFFSAIFFPLEQMHVLLRALAQCSPLYHGVRLSQAALWNESPGLVLLWHVFALFLLTAILVPLAYRRIFPKLYV